MKHDFEKTLRYVRGYFKIKGDLFKAINAFDLPDDVGKFDHFSLNKISQGRLKIGFCYPIELVTKGEITRYMLRPDWFEQDGTVRKPNLLQNVEPEIPKKEVA